MRWLIVLSAILWVTAVEEKYCGKLNECCDGKDDRCGHNYRGSICYCDDFCMDPSREHGDCCPDFKPVCSLVLPPPSNFTKEVQPPPPRTERTALPTCTHKRKTYLENQTATCYCSKCTCKIRSGVAKWECERECLSNEDILFHDVNKERLWKAYVYPEFEKVPLWGAIRKLGTKEARQLVPVKRGKVNIKYFNATEEWGKFITPVVDQGWCGSDVVVAISSVIADRYAINTRGKRLQYPQYKMSCHTPFSSRDVVTALINVRKKGLKSLGSSLRNPTVFGRVRMVYSLRSNDDTMAEIMQAGPVLAVMKVYQDFFHYRKGVYRHSGVGNGRLIGWHTVRILGWGEDNGELYWLAANSWGTRWGEGGYFRIARGVNECNIERFVAGARVLVNSYSYLKHPYH